MRAILVACTHVADTTILKEVGVNTQSDLFWYLGSVLPDFKEAIWNGIDVIIFYDELAETKPNKGRLINGVDAALFGNLVIMGAGGELDPMFTTETIQNYITGVMFETSRGIFNECRDKTSIVNRAIGGARNVQEITHSDSSI